MRRFSQFWQALAWEKSATDSPVLNFSPHDRELPRE